MILNRNAVWVILVSVQNSQCTAIGRMVNCQLGSRQSAHTLDRSCLISDSVRKPFFIPKLLYAAAVRPIKWKDFKFMSSSNECAYHSFIGWIAGTMMHHTLTPERLIAIFASHSRHSQSVRQMIAFMSWKYWQTDWNGLCNIYFMLNCHCHLTIKALIQAVCIQRRSHVSIVPFIR